MSDAVEELTDKLTPEQELYVARVCVKGYREKLEAFRTGLHWMLEQHPDWLDSNAEEFVLLLAFARTVGTCSALLKELEDGTDDTSRALSMDREAYLTHCRKVMRVAAPSSPAPGGKAVE